MKKFKSSKFRKARRGHRKKLFQPALPTHVVESAPVVYIYRSELDYLSRCILDYPAIETGGQMFGFYTDRGDFVVVYVIGPGPRANHQITFFNQDKEYLLKVYHVILSMASKKLESGIHTIS